MQTWEAVQLLLGKTKIDMESLRLEDWATLILQSVKQLKPRLHLYNTVFSPINRVPCGIFDKGLNGEWSPGVVNGFYYEKSWKMLKSPCLPLPFPDEVKIVFLYWPRAEQSPRPSLTRYFLTQEGELYRWTLFGKNLGWTDEHLDRCEVTPLTTEVMREILEKRDLPVLFTILQNILKIAMTHVALIETQLQEDRRLAGVHNTNASLLY